MYLLVIGSYWHPVLRSYIEHYKLAYCVHCPYSRRWTSCVASLKFLFLFIYSIHRSVTGAAGQIWIKLAYMCRWPKKPLILKMVVEYPRGVLGANNGKKVYIFGPPTSDYLVVYIFLNKMRLRKIELRKHLKYFSYVQDKFDTKQLSRDQDHV